MKEKELELRDRIGELWDCQPKLNLIIDPSIHLEEEIEEMIVQLKVKMILHGEQPNIIRNLEKVIKKYFNANTKRKIRGTEANGTGLGGLG